MASSHHLNVGCELRNLPGLTEVKFSGVKPLVPWQAQTLTNDPKNAQDVGGEDDQQVDTSKQDSGDEYVPQPTELLILK